MAKSREPGYDRIPDPTASHQALTMTLPYERNPMPHTLDVRCPACGSAAIFEFGELVRIRDKKDVPFFQESDQFEYVLCEDPLGHRWHGAFYRPGLHGGSTDAIRDLPDGYAPSDWAHPKYLYRRSGSDAGSIVCSHCRHRSPHDLRWPDDALFQVGFQGDVLWAFNYESASELRDFIASKNRSRNIYRWRPFLMKVPTKFLERKAREVVVKRLTRLLNRHAERAPEADAAK